MTLKDLIKNLRKRLKKIQTKIKKYEGFDKFLLESSKEEIKEILSECELSKAENKLCFIINNIKLRIEKYQSIAKCADAYGDWMSRIAFEDRVEILEDILKDYEGILNEEMSNDFKRNS